MAHQSEVLFIGGRSGVGKSTVAGRMHELLSSSEVRHAVIEGDTLDLSWPTAWEHQLAERNLAAIWANYRQLGYRRLIYTNTVSILEMDTLAAAMGDAPQVVGVLLTADDASIENRLTRREAGEALETHLRRSRARAAELHTRAPASVHRVVTDGRSVGEVAAEVLAIAGWGG